MIRCLACGFPNLAGADECDACRAPMTAPAAPRGLEKRILEGSIAALKPKEALTVSAAAPLMEAVEKMRSSKVGCLLVMDGQRLAGVISERELLQNSIDPLKLNGFVGALMRPAETMLEDDPVADAFHAMAVSGHRHLPVRLKGGGFAVVSVRDLLRYLCA